jgi:TldD protein
MTTTAGIERLLVEIVDRARALGCEFADARHMVTRSGGLSLRDIELEGIEDTTTRGVGLRILHDGAWGFAALTDLAHGDIDALVQRAASQAAVARAMSSQHVQLAAEPAHTGSWYSGALIDPVEVPVSEQLDLMRERSAVLLRSPQVNHVDAHLQHVTEVVHYASTDGSLLHQHRIRIMAQWTAIAIDPLTGEFDSMSTTAPPVGRGWEYITGDCHDSGPARRWDWDEEIEALPELLAEKMAAPSVESGTYTLVIHPTNLWLTIHESVGHATELDRSLGYEANYAGTTFVQPDDAGRLQYGSPLMNVAADRTREHGLATVGWDDDGVEAQQWPLITSGVLQGFQVDRSIAAEVGLHRSNGCAYSDAADHVPLQRMPNVSLLPDPAGGTIDELISGVDDGIYIVGDRSWSIDMQRYNFQFTGQRFHRIKSGQLAGQVKDVAYQGSTPTFWKSLVAVGGPSTELLCGALNCGKGQPGQVAPVSHGAPAAVFEDIRVLNTREEGRT